MKRFDLLSRAALLAFFPFITIFTACTNSQPPAESLPEKPPTLNELLSTEQPVELYAKVYQAFRFSSFSALQPSTGGEALEGRTLFERDARGNYHLSRTPLMRGPGVELYHIDQKAYLRSGQETDFRPVHHQVEFDRWAARALREVFSLYQKAGFTGSETVETKGNLNCHRKAEGSLCIDSGTGLPVNGFVRIKVENGILECKFSVAPADTRPVMILPPAGR